MNRLTIYSVDDVEDGVVLDCMHIFCRLCMEQYVMEELIKQELEHGEIRCPDSECP
jgi:hypothetical protein